MLAQADLNDPIGLRDRAILEVLYSTGIRRREVVELSICSLDRDRGTLFIRKGKGRKDRIIPIGERAMAWVEKYVQEVRPKLAMEPDEGILFLTGEGEAVTPGHLTDQVSAYIEKAGIGKKGSCHLFRHTMATLMLEGGADIRFIQQMLGHESLNSTQLYTRVSIRKLKEIHTATHPGARLARRGEKPDDEEPTDAEGERAEVLAQLDEEAEGNGEDPMRVPVARNEEKS